MSARSSCDERAAAVCASFLSNLIHLSKIRGLAPHQQSEKPWPARCYRALLGSDILLLPADTVGTGKDANIPRQPLPVQQKVNKSSLFNIDIFQ